MNGGALLRPSPSERVHHRLEHGPCVVVAFAPCERIGQSECRGLVFGREIGRLFEERHGKVRPRAGVREEPRRFSEASHPSLLVRGVDRRVGDELREPLRVALLAVARCQPIAQRFGLRSVQ